MQKLAYYVEVIECVLNVIEKMYLLQKKMLKKIHKHNCDSSF